MYLPIFIFLFLTISVVEIQPVFGQDKVELRPPIKKHLEPNKPLTTENSKIGQEKLFHSDIDSILDGGSRTKEPIATQVDKVGIELKAAPADSGRKFKAFSVTVSNNSKRTILVRGNSATATIGGATVKAVSMKDIGDSLPNPDGSKHRFIRTAANSATALATVGAIATIKDQINDMGPVRKRYGYDEARREEESARFADRVLYPGESTSGIMYFNGRLGNLSSFRVIISDFDNRKDTASLEYKTGAR